MSPRGDTLTLRHRAGQNRRQTKANTRKWRFWMRHTVEISPCPPISLRTTPRCEPIYDDEAERSIWATAHQLALEWSSPRRPTTEREAAPARPPVRRSVVSGASRDAKLAVHRFV